MQLSSTHTKPVIRSRVILCDSGFRPIVALTLATVLVALAVSHAAAEQHTWLDQFGSSNPERAAAVGAGTNAVFVAGWIDRGALDGTTSNGSIDAFVRCYDKQGLVAWTRQFGTSTTDRAFAVAAIGDGCLVAGSTFGSLGAGNAGVSDAFVQRRNADGDVVWTIQFGTSGTDEVAGLATNGSDVYVVGWTDATVPFPVDIKSGGGFSVLAAGATDMNAFLVKLDANGSVVWNSVRLDTTKRMPSILLMAESMLPGVSVRPWRGRHISGLRMFLSSATIPMVTRSGHDSSARHRVMSHMHWPPT